MAEKRRGSNVKPNLEIAKEVLAGKWGNGNDRRTRLTNAGYNYSDIQSIVNALLSDSGEVQEDTKNEKDIFDNKLYISGTETLEVTVDLNKYKGIKIVFEAN